MRESRPQISHRHGSDADPPPPSSSSSSCCGSSEGEEGEEGEGERQASSSVTSTVFVCGGGGGDGVCVKGGGRVCERGLVGGGQRETHIYTYTWMGLSITI
jgi:hypothetical protein